MSDKQRLDRIERDLQVGEKVLYLEGKTDPEMLFSLLGVSPPEERIHNGAYVVGLSSGVGSGGKEVAALARVAAANGLAGRILGITDGDGRDLSVLAGEFDAPHAGPVFSWKAYCIENMLAKAAWPGSWGDAPSWTDVLNQYAPYAALNRVHRSLRTDLETLGLHRFRNPQNGLELETAQTIGTALAQDKDLIAGRNVAADFTDELAQVNAVIATSVDAGHTQINGKWLCRHYAPTTTNKNEQQCRQDWIAAVEAAGGLAEVRSWWERITGKAP